MLRDEARDLIAMRLGKRPDLNASIVLEMDLAMQVSLSQDATIDAWFLRSDLVTSLTTTAGMQTVAVPSDFVLEVEESVLECYIPETDSWKQLEKVDLDTLLLKYANEPQGRPVRYAHSGLFFHFGPTPDAVYTLRFKYRKLSESVLTGNIENVWLKYAPDLVIAYVSAMMAKEYLQNFELANSIETTSLARAKDRLWRLSEAHQIVNREIVMRDIR